MATSSPVVDNCVHFHLSEPTSSTNGQPLQFVDGSACFPPVDSRRKEIRVLYLLPRSTAENIFCELHVESLSDNSTFEALSYCWGTSDDPVSIKVDGHEFKVTRNLNAALKSLIPGPDSNGPRKLWVDAICINQGHSEDALAERKLQVMLMGDIYNGASFVTAYLGEPSGNVHHAMRYLYWFSRNPEMHFDPQKSPPNQLGLDATSEMLNKALIKFFSYSWWTRMWIVQEYVLAKRLRFQIGNNWLAGEICAKAIQHLFRHQEAGCCDRRSFPAHGQLHETGRRIQDVWALFSNLQSLTKTGRITNILDGLGRFSGRQASDPRDKLFALRSLCTDDAKELIQVNYQQCARCVFVDFTLNWITQYKNLTILSYLDMPRRKGDKSVDMPSFAVNWGKSPQDVLASWHRRAAAQARLFRACKETRSSWTICSADSVIAKGFVFDAVKTVVAGFDGDFYDPDSFGDWLDTTKVLLKDLVYCNAFEAMIRATCSDMMFKDGNFSRISTDHCSLLKLWWNEVTRLYTVNQARPSGMEPRWPAEYPHVRAFDTETIPSIREPIITSALGRDMIVTAKGYLGLAPECCEPGDKVAIMAGGAVPIILRESEIEERSNQSPNLKNPVDTSYEIIGDAYVHGIMDGQAFELCRRTENQIDELILV